MLKVAVLPKDIIQELILTEAFDLIFVKFLELILVVKHFPAGDSGKCDENVSGDKIAHLLENRLQVLVVCRNLGVQFLTSFLQKFVQFFGLVLRVALAVQNAKQFERVSANVVFMCYSLVIVFEDTREKNSHYYTVFIV